MENLPIPFPQFDIVSDPSDHHYVNKTSPVRRNSTSNKKIMDEWKLLEKHLPEGTIYVRVYDTRTDLIRAAIVGAPGTPYHDGLFFFDIYLQPNHPAQPPLVQYRSFGFRINPNLYANGFVCLSLLNTWTGSKPELWDPKKSNILQVLLSIQGLVLNEKPYFNEPGYEANMGKAAWEKKSLEYSENAFVFTCKSMLQLLRNPPKNFEALVIGHFKNRAQFILRASDAYRKGLVRVGQFGGNLSGKGETVEVSKNFPGLMDKLYEELVPAFEKTAGQLQCLVEQVNEKRAKEEAEKKAKEAEEAARKAEEAETKAKEAAKKVEEAEMKAKEAAEKAKEKEAEKKAREMEKNVKVEEKKKLGVKRPGKMSLLGRLKKVFSGRFLKKYR